MNSNTKAVPILTSCNCQKRPKMAKRRDMEDMPTTKGIEKQDRFLTVSIYPDPQSTTPWIRLRGLWLQQAGFSPQTRIRVRVMMGCLVITKE